MGNVTEGLKGYEHKVDRIEIEYFTDPLCCWSWAFEPHWRRFINENKHLIKWRYRMGGLIADWKSFSDPLNDITRPAQMAPLWLQVKYTTQTDIDPDIWLFDPPQTSLPACLAVKTAALQSLAASDLLLLTLRKGVMTEKKNIAQNETIFELARGIEKNYGLLDFEQFKSDFESNKASSALWADLQKVKTANIGRFPTITMQLPLQNKGIMLVGYRPYSVLTEAFKQLTDVFASQE